MTLETHDSDSFEHTGREAVHLIVEHVHLLLHGFLQVSWKKRKGQLLSGARSRGRFVRLTFGDARFLDAVPLVPADELLLVLGQLDLKHSYSERQVLTRSRYDRNFDDFQVATYR